MVINFPLDITPLESLFHKKWDTTLGSFVFQRNSFFKIRKCRLFPSLLALRVRHFQRPQPGLVRDSATTPPTTESKEGEAPCIRFHQPRAYAWLAEPICSGSPQGHWPPHLTAQGNSLDPFSSLAMAAEELIHEGQSPHSGPAARQQWGYCCPHEKQDKQAADSSRTPSLYSRERK
ncbi:hypothetical protein AVEN_256663-1 [Araneus ventricosus]|uniref:Uncharacterized protein n=1 Tax=Araneus ventricosus TaxID=182803 RepID=A0A4Y2RJT6_ARAVE|nr:hypothetical protein AVEN_256663-1 [Araneus ventricosus]